jgi:hypothetical protein
MSDAKLRYYIFKKKGYSYWPIPFAAAAHARAARARRESTDPPYTDRHHYPPRDDGT